MTELQAADFDSFFGELYRDQRGRPLEPFPWQRRLVRRVLGEAGEPPGWPRVLALPTASGKTAAIDVAVFTLACQAEARPEERTAPRRIFFVVDRRVIVDEAFERARRLAKRLAEAGDGVLGRVADHLRATACLDPDEPPLAAHELRGGIYRDDAWARSPLQPTVITSTVDQLGSRLLYRGYGVSSKSWPIHAGLAGHDALVILDEAHCARPFGETLEAVSRYRRWAQEPLAAPFAYVAMTATPRPDTPEEEIFRLKEDDRSHPELIRRLEAEKPIALVPPIPGKTGASRFVRALVDEAEGFVHAGARRIAVLVNRVATARRVYERLDEALGDRVLMIGRMRPWDRDRLMDRWGTLLKAGPGRADHDRPILVVATQCLEVGADLDFDAMVSECASLDALRQRFGRLNRLGRDAARGALRGSLLVASDDLKGKEDDFLYGRALRETWAWLDRHATDAEGRRRVDFGIDPLDRLLADASAADRALRERLAPPAPHAPVLLPAHLDLWAQTAPVPAPDPDVSVFLHGAERNSPEVQVCWRSDLAVPDQENPDWSPLLATWTSTVALLRPTAAECVSVPLYLVRRWLDGTTTSTRALTDVEGAAPPPEEPARTEVDGPRRIALRWRGPEESLIAHRSSPPRPGDTLVIPTALGGWDIFGFVPAGADGSPAVDVAEPPQLERRHRPVLRLHPALLASWPEGPVRTELEDLAAWSEASAEENDFAARAREALERAMDEGAAPADLAGSLRELLDRGFDALPHPSGTGWVLCGRPRPRPEPEVLALAAETFTSDDDSASATVNVPLGDHCGKVGELAGRFAEAGGLPDTLVEDLRLAGTLHDLGKADRRFQAWLYDGSTLAAQLGPLLAKSERLPESLRERERARRRAGYPRGARHELVSIRLAESAPDVLGSAHDPELVLHLIGSHHGRCRPLAPVVDEDEPVEVRVEVDQAGHRLQASSATGLERLDSGTAERFWRLLRRYGWWGLALLEAVLRLADHRRSEAEERLFVATESTGERRVS